jgi:hypothetical protein
MVVVLILMLPLGTRAGTLTCDGKVETIAYHGNNKLMVKLSSMNTPVFFCNPSSSWKVDGEPSRVMEPETCQAVFSMFLSARATGDHIGRVHFDGAEVPSSCNQFGSWKNVFIRYVNY